MRQSVVKQLEKVCGGKWIYNRKLYQWECADGRRMVFVHNIGATLYKPGKCEEIIPVFKRREPLYSREELKEMIKEAGLK